MDEIRLTCASCGVQYRLPGNAIPPAGREVECTACGHSWLARPQVTPPGLQPSSTPGDDPVEDEPTAEPRLSRPLPANVLAILRDELDFERRARAGEASAPMAGPAAGTPGPAPDWPATTLRWPDPAAPQPPADMASDSAQSAVARPLPAPIGLSPDATHRRGQRQYRIGFGLAAMLGLLVLTFYLLAPTLGDAGPWGKRLAEARASIDDGRTRLRAALFDPQ